VRVGFDEDDVRALGRRDPADQQPDRPTADDDGSLVWREAGTTYVVNGDGGRLHQGGVIERKMTGQAYDDTARNVPASLHRARQVDPDDLQALAHMGVAGPAGGTPTAPHQRHHRDRVTDLPAGVDPGAECRDPAGGLVAEDGGGRHPGVHVALPDVQVGAADAGVRHIDLDLPGTGGFGHTVLDDEPLVSGIERCAHGAVLRAGHVEGAQSRRVWSWPYWPY
jgi:hypothetical protein